MITLCILYLTKAFQLGSLIMIMANAVQDRKPEKDIF
jgi:hypothetical protein